MFSMRLVFHFSSHSLLSTSPVLLLSIGPCRFVPSPPSGLFSQHLLYSNTSPISHQPSSPLISKFPLPYLPLPNHGIHLFPIPFFTLPSSYLVPFFFSHFIPSLPSLPPSSFLPFTLCQSVLGPALNIFRTPS